MPKNRIEIIDNTGEAAIYNRYLTVYIPGPVSEDEDPDLNLTFCDNVSIGSSTLKTTSLVMQAIDHKWDTTALSFKLAYYLIKKYNCRIIYQGISSSQVESEGFIKAIGGDSGLMNLKYSDYAIDYITTGQFGGVYKELAECAEVRKDCAYLADHTNIEFNQTVQYILLTADEAPEDWATAEDRYYSYTEEHYEQLLEGGEHEWALNTYYEKFESTATTEVEYKLLATEPEDWNTVAVYTKYFIKVDPTYTAITSGTTYEANTYYKKIQITTSAEYCKEVRDQFEEVFLGDDPNFDINNDISIYAAGFTPWFNPEVRVTNTINGKFIVNAKEYNVGFASTDTIPAAFGYLFAYSRSIQDNPLWFASAGPERGIIAELKTPVVKYNRLDVEVLQARATIHAVGLDEEGDNIGIAINPIANIRPFGYILYGNRTLRYNSQNEESTQLIGELKATSFLNIRNLVSLIARTSMEAAERYKFDQNDSILWTKFSSVLKPVLDGAVSGSGILGYRLSKVETTKKARLKAKLIVIPLEAVEDLDLTIELADSLDISVSE